MKISPIGILTIVELICCLVMKIYPGDKSIICATMAFMVVMVIALCAIVSAIKEKKEEGNQL